MAKESWRDQLRHEIFSVECYLTGFYLQKSRKKNIKIKNFSIFNYAVYLTPDKFFDPFVEISNDLSMNRDAFVKLLQKM